MKVLGLGIAFILVLSSPESSMAGRDRYYLRSKDNVNFTGSPEQTKPLSLKRKLNGKIEYDEGSLSQQDKKAQTEKKIPLKKHIANLQQHIEEARQEANAKKIRELYETFQQVSYSESTCRNAALALKIYRWPSQETWKEVVGGHLFFPKDILDWEERTSSPYYSYLAKRIDTLWSLAVGAKFHHALSKFYLSRVLLEIFSAFTDADMPSFFDRLFKEAFADLIQCEDNPDVCFAIGSSNGAPNYISRQYLKEGKFEKRAAELHQKSNDTRNLFRLLILRLWDKVDFGDESPSFEEFWALGEQGYKPAYLEAYLLVKEDEKKLEILNKIIKSGYLPAWIRMGHFYKKKGNITEARQCYLKAAEARLIQGYIDLGKTYVGDILLPPSKLKEECSEEDINQAIKYFTLAGENKHQEGWNYLAKLYLAILEKKVNEGVEKTILDEYYEKAYKALQQGMALGSASCYHAMFNYYDKDDFLQNVAWFGNPPQERLREDIGDFLYKEK